MEPPLLVPELPLVPPLMPLPPELPLVPPLMPLPPELPLVPPLAPLAPELPVVPELPLAPEVDDSFLERCFFDFFLLSWVPDAPELSVLELPLAEGEELLPMLPADEPEVPDAPDVSEERELPGAALEEPEEPEVPEAPDVPEVPEEPMLPLAAESPEERLLGEDDMPDCDDDDGLSLALVPPEVCASAIEDTEATRTNDRD